jgi:CHAD domain-containing protein
MAWQSKINYAMDTEAMEEFRVGINRLFDVLILPRSCNNDWKVEYYIYFHGAGRSLAEALMK